MGPYGSENFKTLLLQITAESFQTFPEFSSQWSSQDYVWVFEILKIEIFYDFLFVFVNMGPNGSENFFTLLLLKIAAESVQTFPESSSQWSSQNCIWSF